MQRIVWVARDDTLIDEIAPADVFALVRTEQINGEHSLEITTSVELPKETRLLTQDETGKWREWVVMGEDAEHASGRRPIGTYYAVWSLQHDMAVTTVDAMPGTQTPVVAALALDAALGGTDRWVRGTVTQTTTGGASMWYKSGWEALSTVVEVWGGELDATIEVSQTKVTGRKVNLYSKMGDQTARRRFDWGHDLTGIRRKVEEAPMAVRIIPRGKGEETDSGGYGRKIDITSVNGGVEYLQNDETAPLYRLSNGQGGWEYPTVVVENGDMETPADLKQWARGVLEDYTTPRVTYDGDVLQLARAGLNPYGVGLGDAIQCVDRGFSEEGLRIRGRVVAMKVNELDENDVKLTIGYIEQGIAKRLKGIARIEQAVANMNGGTFTTADYLNSLLKRLNGEINATGGYTYITEGQGIRTYDKAVTDPLVGAEADKVTEIKGGTVRIADSRTSQGEWNWRTVFVSGHIAADMVTAAQLTAGYIGSPSGNFWDLDTGELKMAANTKIGNKTAAEIAAEAVDAQTQQSIFNKLTNNGQTQGIYLSNGKLYINATYMKAGIISDGAGKNTWNLSTGALTTNSMTANNMTAVNMNATGSLTTGGNSGAKTTVSGGKVQFFYNNSASGSITGATNSSGSYLTIEANSNMLLKAGQIRYANGSWSGSGYNAYLTVVTKVTPGATVSDPISIEYKRLQFTQGAMTSSF